MELTSPPRYPAFAKLLEDTLRARNLTQAEASRQIGCGTSRMSRYLHGGGISLPELEKVAVWADVPLAQLMPLVGFPPPMPFVASDPADPRFHAVRTLWDHLDEARKQVIHEIAVAGGTLSRALTPDKGIISATA